MIRPLAAGLAAGLLLHVAVTTAAWFAVPVLAALLEND